MQVPSSSQLLPSFAFPPEQRQALGDKAGNDVADRGQVLVHQLGRRHEADTEA